MDDEKNFYDQHFIAIWLILGVLLTLIGAAIQGGVFGHGEKTGLLILMLVLASPLLALFWASVFMLTRFLFSILSEGVTVRNPVHVLVALWFLAGVILFVIGAFMNP